MFNVSVQLNSSEDIVIQDINFTTTANGFGVEYLLNCTQIRIGRYDMSYHLVSSTPMIPDEYGIEMDHAHMVYNGIRWIFGNDSRIVDFGDTPQTVSQEFFEIFTSTATQEFTTIRYNNSTIAIIIEGQTVTLHTEGLKAIEDIVIKNVGEVEEKTYTLSGTWLFNSAITGYSTGYSISAVDSQGFLCYGTTYYRIENVWSSWEDLSYDYIQYGNLNGTSCTTVNKSTAGWIHNNYRTITFNGTWYVDKEFYDWFTANAEKSHSPIPV